MIEPEEAAYERCLGKIESAYFGVREGKLGVHIAFTFTYGGVAMSYGVWDFATVERSEHASWTEEDRAEQLRINMVELSHWLYDAKVSKVEDLKNTPVELTINTNTKTLARWRVLTEVL